MNQDSIRQLAERLATDCVEAHRGAFWWEEKGRVAVAFGNDGHPSALAQPAILEVETVRRLLAENGGKELGFAEGGTLGWTMGVQLPETLSPDILEGVLWHAFHAWATSQGNRVKERENIEEPVPPVELDWETIRAVVDGKLSVSRLPLYVAHQANAARVVLDRNGLM